jgi:hypothetical protein
MFSLRCSSRSHASHIFVITKIVVVLLQVVLAVAVFRHAERAFERESFPCVAIVGGALAPQVCS